MNKLLIKEKSVEINTDILYQGIEIRYKGELYINNKLPNDFIVQKGNNKIIIIRFSNNDEIIEELFEYNGNCNIYYAKMVDKDLNEYDLITKKPALQTWSALGTKRLDDNSTSKYLWESLTTDYDDLTFNGNNSYVKSLKQVSKIDNEANTITTTKETSRKLSYLGKKDTGLTRFGDFNTNTNKTKKSLKKGQQIKRGY